MKVLLVTGSSGLIGSEVCRHFDQLGWKIYLDMVYSSLHLP